MSSPFVELAMAQQSLLLAMPALAGGVIWRDRLKPLKAGQLEAIVIKLLASRGTRAGVASGPIDWLTTYGIECYRRCAADEIPTEMVDPTLSAVFARLSGVGPGLAQGVEDVLPDPAIDWDLGDGETPLVCATLQVRIVHRTQAAQLVAWN